jgi:hypothetical protein
MSETTPAENDDIRQHSQDPAEGPDGTPDGSAPAEDDDVPREHTQEPAEG